ncbi:MAG: hypothetical protein AAGA20_06230 [Planctomycetota bacterium]
MLVRFVKLTDRRHALEIERGGDVERVELETRSTLFHDLTHLAVEQASQASDGFFVALAGGATMAEIAHHAREGRPYPPAAMEVERAVAMLQSLAKHDESPDALHARIVESLAAQDQVPPDWLTAELVATVRTRLRSLVGAWRATRYGEALTVDWD